ncbi:31336_t:CDS:1, partial [Racocetra persica]
MVNNDELNLQQKLRIQEFLLNKVKIFAQGLENLKYTNITTHVIST